MHWISKYLVKKKKVIREAYLYEGSKRLG